MSKYKLGQYGEHVFLYDESGKTLIRKFWFYPSGLVTYREWNLKGEQTSGGERRLVGEYSSHFTTNHDGGESG